MSYRKLRIAWSVAWGVLAVLICVLWVRSYWWGDFTTAISGHHIKSLQGKLFIDEMVAVSSRSSGPTVTHRFGIDTFPIEDMTFTPSGVGLNVPYWALDLAFAILTVAPWISFKRFSLRTLLIATTVIAVVLGGIAFALR